MGSFPLPFFSLHSKSHCMDLGETYFLLKTNCLTQKREGEGGGGAQTQRSRIKSIRPQIVLHTTFEPRCPFGALKQKGKCDLFLLHHFNHAACKMLIYYYSLKYLRKFILFSDLNISLHSIRSSFSFLLPTSITILTIIITPITYVNSICVC